MMKKKLILFIFTLFMLCITVNALPINLGCKLGSNMNSVEGWAFDYGIQADYKIFENFFVGVDFAMSSDFEEIYAIEPSVYAKYYLPFSFLFFTPFVQANTGLSVLILDDSNYYMLGGITVGAKVNLEVLNKFYFEPQISFGYPYFFAINLVCGYSL